MNEPVEAILETDALTAVVVRRLHHRADHRIEARRIPSAGQDTEARNGRHLVILAVLAADADGPAAFERRCIPQVDVGLLPSRVCRDLNLPSRIAVCVAARSHMPAASRPEGR